MTVQVNIFTLFGWLVAADSPGDLSHPDGMAGEKTAQEAEALLRDLRRELMPSLRDFREIAERLNRASTQVEQGAGKAEHRLEAVDEFAASIRLINGFLQKDLVRFFENAACLMLGLRAAGKVFLNGLQEKGD
jgi:hypothetical protein